MHYEVVHLCPSYYGFYTRLLCFFRYHESQRQELRSSADYVTTLLTHGTVQLQQLAVRLIDDYAIDKTFSCSKLTYSMCVQNKRDDSEFRF
jgi:hypothetical protein